MSYNFDTASGWSELIVDCAVWPLTAVYQCQPNELFHSCAILVDMEAVVFEGAQTALAAGYDLDQHDLRDRIQHLCKDAAAGQISGDAYCIEQLIERGMYLNVALPTCIRISSRISK